MSEGRVSPPKPRSSASEKAPGAEAASGTSWGLRVFDAVLIGFFLTLGFLLGVFRLKDTDFYWHLRTGDIIRQSGQIPRVDFYTFTRAGTPWIDLHWIFQVAISWVHDLGGIPALTLAKCLVTCVALLLLITARRRTWPVWAMILAWIPALLVLSGRMYIRPETLTLLYLSMFLAVLCRWDRRPWLAWILPFVQVAWVNSHGLFILGPIILGFALIDAALRRGALAVDRRRWWSTVVPASAATGLACLLNPYGLHGAIYPLELAATMRGADFSRTIAELKPIPQFIQETGFGSVPLQIHFATIVLGALSFLIPIFDAGASRLRGVKAGGGPAAEPEPEGRKRKGAKGSDAASRKPAKGRKTKATAVVPDDAAEPAWRISVLRLLLFAAFSILSLQATRNSHQFAAVVGTITAWNFAEWVAARQARREAAGGPDSRSDGVRPRLVALVALIFLTFAVGSGLFYTWAGEGRVIGWGEEPLWFPHESADFAGGADMPERFLSFHNGHASLFIYYHSPEKPKGPGKTVFTDPRLEVTGPELYRRYLDLKDWITKDNPRWQRELDAEGRPSILVDHEYNTEVGAALLRSGRWRCVRFDDISAVFVHESYQEAVASHEVDFAARHFRPSAEFEPQGEAALIAASKGLRNYANFLGGGGGGLTRPILWLALDYARRVVKAEPDSLEGWKSLGYAEMLRDPTAPSARCRFPFDPVFDLSPVRSTYALRRASAIAPRDFLSLAVLQKSYENRGMLEPLIAVLDRVLELSPINLQQSGLQNEAANLRGPIAQRLAEPIPATWKNLDELDRLVNHELEIGRVETAARLLENAYPPGKGGWDAVERLSTILLHLGEPGRAREVLRQAPNVPNPAVRDARLAVCDLVEGRFDKARELYQRAVEADPRLFEARYGLAVLEQDDARAEAAYEQAMAAVDCAPGDAAWSVAQAVAASVRRFAAPDRPE